MTIIDLHSYRREERLTMSPELLEILKNLENAISFVVDQYEDEIPEMELDTLLIARDACGEMVRTYSDHLA